MNRPTPDFDIAARMEQIVGRPPRIAPIAQDQLSEDQLAMIHALRGSVGAAVATEIPEFFLIAVKHPALFRCQMDSGTMLFNGTIPPRERELAVLRLSWLSRAPYEWGEHVDIAKRYGVTAAEVERATEGSAAPGWSAHDAAILRGVEELLADYAMSDATWDVLAQSWSEQQLMEFPMLVGAYISTAFQQNSLRMRLASKNPGLSHR